MAVKDVTLTLVGAQAAVAQVVLYPQVDGSCVLVATGVTKDNAAKLVTLAEAKLSIPAGTPAIDNLLARALQELRKANGLE